MGGFRHFQTQLIFQRAGLAMSDLQRQRFFCILLIFHHRSTIPGSWEPLTFCLQPSNYAFNT